MAHHQQPWYRFTTHDDSFQSGLRLPKEAPRTDDAESVAYLDEPQDENICFARLHSSNNQEKPYIRRYNKPPSLHQLGTSSLLTQALLTNSELFHCSDTELSLLTANGGLTSSTQSISPSPPPTQNTAATELSPTIATQTCKVTVTDKSKIKLSAQPEEYRDKPAEKTVEAGLGRRRCITFACGRQAASIINRVTSPTETSEDISNPIFASKRPRLLRFACPMKPSPGAVGIIEPDKIHSNPLQTPILSSYQQTMPNSYSSRRRHGPSSACGSSGKGNASVDLQSNCNAQKLPVSNRTKLELSEATRFHEFAGRFDVDDEWINQPMAPRQKITVNDTLRKENEIRRLAEEADEESLEEYGDHDAESLDNLGKLDDVDDFESDDEASDGGNESDNEEGFADSDDDSDQGSQYEFWTPGVTTAATSLDYMEHVRPISQRFASDSSLDSLIKSHEKAAGYKFSNKRSRDSHRTRKSPKMRPGTPDLPDSTDFVCGTLDEDRPLEAAYLSCLEERRRSRHKIIPQDIDPSFPTSDPEADEDEADDKGLLGDEHTWMVEHPDNSDEESSKRKSKDDSRKIGRSPMPSPKRARSPAPRRGIIYRSPPPRKLFGQSPGDRRSTSEFYQKVHSPPSTRRTSFCKSPRHQFQGIAVSHLAQRPHPTHTTSLPRTPNPFWRQHREGRSNDSDSTSKAASPTKADLHSRGPIEIVRGLENRRQRRKEKLWRQHCRYAGKEKERKCQPGRGAERMRELGLEMANKAREYGHKGDLILSV